MIRITEFLTVKKQISNLLVLACFVAPIATFQSCMKEADLPALRTSEASNIKSLSASLGGNVTDDGRAKIDLRGVCWGTADNPTISDSKKYYWEGMGSFACLVTGLTPDTYYHVRAFATNMVGIAYGNEVHFRTKPAIIASLTAITPTMITHFSAESGAYIWDDGGTPILERGVCLSLNENPTINDRKILAYSWIIPDELGRGPFGCLITGLKPSTLYHIRAYVINLAGIAYSDDRYFETYPLPVVTTKAISVFTQTTARVDAVLKLNCPEYLVWHTGVCYGTTTAPKNDGHNVYIAPYNEKGEFTSYLSNLTPGTLYYIRAYVTVYENMHIGEDNLYKQIAIYGNEVTFTTSP